MCGRFSLGASATTLAAQFDLFEVPAWTPRYNIAPTQEVLVVVAEPTKSQRQARRHRWGLIPSWAKDLAIRNQLINAQAESAATKPAFRAAFRKRRCLILATGSTSGGRRAGISSRSTFASTTGNPSRLPGWGGTGKGLTERPSARALEFPPVPPRGVSKLLLDPSGGSAHSAGSQEYRPAGHSPIRKGNEL